MSTLPSRFRRALRPLSVPKLAATLCFAALTGCVGNPYVEQASRNDVITLGDSIFDLSGEIELILEQYAGQTFRNYSQSGAELEGGSIARSVIGQYSDARQTNPNINTVVMDGGGNDVLIPAMIFDPYGCRTHWWRWNISSSCRALIDDTYVNGVDLLNQMDADNVQHVIYLGYYHLPRSNSNLSKAVDYGDKRLKDACDNSTVNCVFKDPRGLIGASDVLSDNIHPTSSGSQKLADLLWPALQAVL